MAWPAGAASLGRPQGNALIGRPLQLSLPVTINAGEEACVRAEMAQGEETPTALNWRLEPRADGSGTLRLNSAGAVHEPVLTVRVAIGCGDQLAQSFVLLADLPPPRENLPLLDNRPPDTQAPPTARPAAAVTSPPAAVRASAAGSAAERTPPRARRTARPRADESAAAATRRFEARPAAGERSASSRTARTSGSRLRVDVLDFAIDQAPALKAASALASPVAGAGSGALTREQAQAAWQQLNAPVTEQWTALLKQNEATLAELRNLREVTRKQAEQLNQLRTERNLVRDILAGLAGAIALGLAVLLWRRYRDASGAPWWQAGRQQQLRREHRASFVDSGSPEPRPPAAPAAADEDSGRGGSGRPGEAQANAPPPDAHAAQARASTFGDSMIGRSSRQPTAEELLDVQEKANFFLAIGQPDQAVEMLETRLMEPLGSSPFLWLLLLDLCRRLDRPDDYERVRQDFQRAFGGRLPAFGQAQPNTEGLERYPRALSRITLLWPSSRVLTEIEQSLFEDPAPGSVMFDLEASRDLLLLYGIAQEAVSGHMQGQPDASAAVSAVEPLAVGGAAAGTEPVPLVALDSEGPDQQTDLDLDFSQLEVAPPRRGTAAAHARPEPPATVAQPAPLHLDFSPHAALGPPLAAATAQDVPSEATSLLVDLPLDDFPASAADSLTLLERPAAAAALTDDRVDTTPPEPPLLADLKLDGLTLEEVQPEDFPLQDTPLPQVDMQEAQPGRATAQPPARRA